MMKIFPINYMVEKYKQAQIDWCKRLLLQPTDVVHFATGESYNNKENFCSPFNVQDNRYNLGMLYENQNLLTKLGYCE